MAEGAISATGTRSPLSGEEKAGIGVAYRSDARVDETPSDALVLMCSDRQFQPAFQEFLSQGLGLRRWDAMAAPGGAYVLAFAEVLPKQLKVGMRSLKFIMQASAPPRIVVISHEGCKRYLEAFHSKLQRLGFSLPDKQKKDLASVASDLREAFPGTPVEAYFAAIAIDGRVEFERV